MQHRRIDHRRLHIVVAQPCLHYPAIVALLERMRRNAVPQGMTADAFGEPSHSTRSTDGPWQSTLMGVMAADDPRPWVFRQPVGGKDVLPDPEPAGTGVFAFQRKRSVDWGDAVSDIVRMEALDA
jgi:hypothetical protein